MNPRNVSGPADSAAGLRFDADAAHAAAVGLETLAQRLVAALRGGERVLAVVPAGRDEVSHRAARTMTAAAGSYVGHADSAVRELRSLAEILRTHAARLADVERDSAAEVGGAR